MLLRENIKGGTSKYKTDVKLSIEGEYFVASFVSEDSSLDSYSDKYNDVLWRSNAVEVFLDVGRENKYWEVEVAPNGVIFLAEVTRVDNKNTLRMIDECFVDASVSTSGGTYKTRIRIPLVKLGYEKSKGLKLNAFRIETKGKEQYLMSLFPTLCETFHKPEAFKDILFAVEK